jgi:uncharacterized protein (DUF1501 family)
MISRRRFVQGSAGIAVLGGAVPRFLMGVADAQPLADANADPDNVLVVVQMNGGNDGLNTVVPYSDDAYHRVRPAIRVGETTVLKIDDRVGLNPVMAPLMELYKEGNVAIVQGVGYPNPNRSHFEATQIWETAAPDRPLNYGWLGRYLDRTTPRVNGAVPDPGSAFKAVSLLDTIPMALEAQHVDVPAIGQLNTFGYNGGGTKAQAGVLYDGARPGQSPYLNLIESTAREAIHGGEVLKAKTASYKPAVTYPTDPFSSQLRQAAAIITSGLNTRIVFVSIGSFDTHAGQRNQQDRLLGYMASGIKAFYADLASRGMSNKVLLMTFSEFGRRVAQNASNGTDHGTAAPLFMVGGKVKGGLYGQQPSLTDLDHGDLKFNTDFRSVYATVIQRWMGRDPSDVIAGTFEQLPVV